MLLRHAKSSWSDPRLSDLQRPLASRGKADAKRMARYIAEHAPQIDLVLCSTAKRARQTWAAVARVLAHEPEVRFESALYLPSLDTLLEVIRSAPDQARTLLVVGHSPSLDALVMGLSLSARDAALRAQVSEKLPTGALVALTLSASSYAEAGIAPARLTSLVTPRALRGSRPEPRKPAKADALVLGKHPSVLTAAQAALTGCMQQIRANLEGARVSDDLEFVHQARVGLRRLRAALRMFRRLLDPEQYTHLAQELRWIFRLLGAVRDYDVFLRDTLSPLREEVSSRALSRLEMALAEERASAVEAARKALASPRFAALLRHLLALESELSSRHDDTPPLRGWARKRLDRRLNRVRSACDGDLHDTARRHELRKQLKKLRYSAEFVSDPFGDAALRYLKRLTKVQDQLGELNDVAVGEQLLSHVPAELPRSTRLAVRRAREALGTRASVADEKLALALHAFMKARPFWR